MKLYIVDYVIPWEGCLLQGVFSTREKAEKYVEQQKCPELEISEIELDALVKD